LKKKHQNEIEKAIMRKRERKRDEYRENEWRKSIKDDGKEASWNKDI